MAGREHNPGPGRIIRLMPALAALWLALAGPAWAAGGSGWLIDQDGFARSVHAELSCQDCHQEHQPPGHPNPALVKLPSGPKFSPQMCADCHQETLDEIAAGSHADQKITDRAKADNCLACHDPHLQPARELDAPTELSTEDTDCLACHAKTAARTAKPVLCLHCHDPRAETADPAVDLNALAAGPHGGQTCLTCHARAAAYGHGSQPAVDCLACHQRHDAAQIGDVHSGVDCLACHQAGAKVRRHKATGRITAQPASDAQGVILAHGLADTESRARCLLCHQPGNRVGAAASVLPSKSVVCMPCHAATFTANDPLSLAALIIFGLGLISAAIYWLGGRGPNWSGHGPIRAGEALKALILDGLVQRRLWQISPWRGLIHALVFWPFVVRFGWGLIGLLASLLTPGWGPTWDLLDNNWPPAALMWDVTGLLVLIGAALAIIRRLAQRGRTVPGLPGPDWLGLGLLAAMVVMGFVVKSARLALTHTPPGSECAFLSYQLSRLWADGPGLSQIYVYLWYIHAGLAAAFIAYLPFGRLFHIVLAPLSAALGRGRGPDKAIREDKK